LTADQKNKIQIFLDDTPIKFAITYNEKPKNDIEADTIICVIDHKINNLSPYKDYTFTILLGEENPATIKLHVLEYGLLPSYDKDSKKARVHIMGYDNKEKQWGRIGIIKKNDTNCLPIIIVNTDELAEKIAEKLKG
jgi:hypothetical protein